MLGQWSVAIFSSNTFTVRVTDQINVRGRVVRRISLSNDAIKLAKLFAGDVVALTATSEICQRLCATIKWREPQQQVRPPERDHIYVYRVPHNFRAVRDSLEFRK